MKRFNADMYRFKWTQDEDDTIQNTYESIQVQIKEFCETIQLEKRRFKYESIQVGVNRIIFILGSLESIHICIELFHSACFSALIALVGLYG